MKIQCLIQNELGNEESQPQASDLGLQPPSLPCRHPTLGLRLMVQVFRSLGSFVSFGLFGSFGVFGVFSGLEGV